MQSLMTNLRDHCSTGGCPLPMCMLYAYNSMIYIVMPSSTLLCMYRGHR